ncbi:CDP-alcohol phosphatidyltransferase [Singulisphaera sp. Ch08]|uniref:Phosphatidylcholine synthase n=1 Tax=Singulisphaera sp. Ch08 TaxID=3120278 RepID=A0AAU7CR58_9BACT
MQDQAKRKHRGEQDGIRPALWFAAWCVHLYTALGLVIAAWIAVLLVRGGADAYRGVFLLMMLATFVDATDGTLARKVRVKKVLPNFDGRKLDDITDFLTYTFLPLMLIWRANLLPAGTNGWLILPLLASAYGFCQVEAKTDDGYFLGFPSLWNIVALYLYILQLPGPFALVVVIVLSLLTFVPSRYLYPSQPGAFNMLNNVLGAIWAGLLTWLLIQLPAAQLPPRHGSNWNLAVASLSYPAFYMLASWVITLNHWRKPRPTLEPVGAGASHFPSH